MKFSVSEFGRICRRVQRLGRDVGKLALFCALCAAPLADAQVSVVGQAGARDRDFGALISGGQSGVYVFAANTMTSASMVGTQSNGLSVVVGTCNANPSEDMCVARLNRDGWQLDSTFGNNGLTQYVLTGQDYPRTAVIDAADRIIAAGICNGTSLPACIVRFNANGTLDTTFGNSGRGGVSGMREIQKIRFDSDGRMVVAGECFQSAQSRPCVARLTAAGVLDSTFNAGAVLVLGFPNASYQAASDLTFDASGRILIAAYCNAQFNAVQYGRFCAIRVTSAGAIDSTFNGGVGRIYALQTATVNCSSSAISVQSSGKIIVAGVCDSGNGNVFAISRLNENGDFDTSFGQDAYAGLSFQWIGSALFANFTRLYVDEQDRILLGGYCQVGFCLARALPNGRADALFARQGVALYKPDVGFEIWQQSAEALHVVDRNRLYLAGSCGRSAIDRRACVTRHFVDTPPGERCSLDLDGDGEINAATDALLWARVHLGIRGAALTQNAVGARAQRTTPDAIMNHLGTHCSIR
ncbi:MAG: hypothetical protein EAZ21_05475 [Betaproteobacteria bacterium]|nr:MAG: hypothetical protein EAZ21_05475 [Betaproteobacteria bacterium]